MEADPVRETRLGRVPSFAAMYLGLGVMLIVWWLASGYWLLVLFALLFLFIYVAVYVFAKLTKPPPDRRAAG